MAKKVTKLADLSDDDKRQLLSRALGKLSIADTDHDGDLDVYIRDVYSAYFVFYNYDTSTIYKCDYTLGDDKVVVLGEPVEVTQRTVYEPVAMSANFAYLDGDHRIYPATEIFRAGIYEDKGFSMTPDELRATAAAFAGPVPLNLAHSNDMLVGKCGHLRKAWPSADGGVLFGEVAVPTWLDDRLDADERKVSAEFGLIEGKPLVGLALTTKPRVETAALMSAFTAANPPVAPAKEIVKMANEPTAEQVEIEKLKSQVAQMSATNRSITAEKLADEFIRSNHALPSEKAVMVALFTQAANDDEAAPAVVKFTLGETEVLFSRLETVRAAYMARPTHVLTQETLQSAGLSNDEMAVLFARSGSAPSADGETRATLESKKRLMELTPAGKAALAAMG